jgi:hypothetical protein
VTKSTRILYSTLISQVAMVPSFVLIAGGTLVWLNLKYYTPNDPSSGDAIGWMIVASMPLLAPLSIVASLFMGLAAFVISFVALRRYVMPAKFQTEPLPRLCQEPRLPPEPSWVEISAGNCSTIQRHSGKICTSRSVPRAVIAYSTRGGTCG